MNKLLVIGVVAIVLIVVAAIALGGIPLKSEPKDLKKDLFFSSIDLESFPPEYMGTAMLRPVSGSGIKPLSVSMSFDYVDVNGKVLFTENKTVERPFNDGNFKPVLLQGSKFSGDVPVKIVGSITDVVV